MAEKRKKISYDMEVLFCIEVLKGMGKIKDWKEGARLYFDLTKQEVAPNSLARKVGSIMLSDINHQKFLLCLRDCEKTLSLYEEGISKVTDARVERNNDLSEKIVQTFAITDNDLITKFGIDLNSDDTLTKKRKIMIKFSDDIFLLEYLGFDPGRFEIKKFDIGSWSTPVKEEYKTGEKLVIEVLNEKYNVVVGPRKKPLFYISREECEHFLDEFLKRKRLTPFDLFNEKFQGEFDLKPVDISQKNNRYIMICPGLELHLGKLGSVVDYEDYSTKQAMWRLRFVAKALVEYQKKYNASKLLLGIGNDYFNSDTTDDKTTAGTPQNNDTRFKEVYLWGKIGYMRLIETAKEYFDEVILKGNPGNHDEKSSYSLLTFLYYIYDLMKDKKVKINITYEDLRFTTGYVFGDNLIVFSHGKSPEGKSLNDQRLAEAVRNYFPNEFHQAKRVYVFAGHLHKDSKYTYGNVTIIRTAALTGVENWHYSNSYIADRQGHSLYVIDKERGLIGTEYITLNDKDKVEKIGAISREPKADVNEEMIDALNLSSTVVEEEKLIKELDDVDFLIDQIDEKYCEVINNLMVTLDINKDSLTKEQLIAVKNALGYYNQIEPIEQRRDIAKRYLKK